MIVYVDIEHLRVKEHAANWQTHLQRTLDIKYKLEAISGDNCIIVRYEKLSPDLLQSLNARAVVISGNITEFQHYDEANLAGLRAVIQQATRPTIGFCGGAMMIAETFGARAAAIDESAQGDMQDESWRERTHEFGFVQVRKTAPHPLFAGLGGDMAFMEAHYWEIKDVPIGFKNFAATTKTPIQFLAHDSMPLFASQFHPESFNDDNADGRAFLDNFFKLMA